jgi:Holliday junction resolvase
MSYKKGAHYERDLMHFLTYKGFSTLRVAGSGHNSPADIVAIKDGNILVIECKAHLKKPRLQRDKVQEMKEWCDRAGAFGFLAWRAPNQDWLFLGMRDVEQGKYEDGNWLTKEGFLKVFSVE